MTALVTTDGQSGILDPNTRVSVWFPNPFHFEGGQMRNGIIQYFQTGNFERAYSWPRRLFRYCVRLEPLYPGAGEEINEWVDAAHVTPAVAKMAEKNACVSFTRTPQQVARDAIEAALSLPAEEGPAVERDPDGSIWRAGSADANGKRKITPSWR